MSDILGMLPLTYEEKKSLRRFLRQDSGKGDLTSLLFDDDRGAARIISEEDCVLSGTQAVQFLFAETGCSLEWNGGACPGSLCGKGAAIATVEGPVEGILRAERPALNLLSRMSGIATAAREASEKAHKASPGTRVAGTRKTTPGLQMFEKRALIDGGALPHRYDLSSMAMLKDNHIAALGGGADAVIAGVEMLRDTYGPYINIEVEVEDIACAMAALEAGADIIMLDNFSPEGVKLASKSLSKAAQKRSLKLTLEASGGITVDDLGLYAPYVDVISMGSLTYGSRPKGFKLEMERSQD
ncbi:MAG: carboxylating nicotinate-nucleotide diphosphorylase [Thermoplasmatota archaeon]